MKKLDVSSITDSAEMPIKSGTLQFLQDANSEVFSSMLIGLIGSSYNPNAIYILYGAVNSGIGLTYNISAGACFYQGEVFQIDLTSFTMTSGNPVFSIATTQYTTNADPVTFTNNSQYNVHNIRKMAISAGGASIGDYSSAIYLNFYIPPKLNASGAGVSGTYPNLVFAASDPNVVYGNGAAILSNGVGATFVFNNLFYSKVGNVVTLKWIANFTGWNQTAFVNGRAEVYLTLPYPANANVVTIGNQANIVSGDTCLIYDTTNPSHDITALASIISSSSLKLALQQTSYASDTYYINFTYTYICQ